MNGNIIVWDLETIPDLRGFGAAKGLTGKTEEELIEALGDKFPKHIYHSIVCIGALVAHREQSGLVVDALGAPYIGERTEKQRISSFTGRIAELNPQLISFNGHGFDLPVLRYRAMVHGVSAPGLAARPYFNRYTEDALDLCDILSSFSAQGKASLDELSRILGLPGKPDGMDGSQVFGCFREGRIKEIADYCETDTVNTYRVWLRYELFRGRLSESEYAASEVDLIELIKVRQATKPHLMPMAAQGIDPAIPA
jgi:3'-5' exonuclease